MHLCDVKLSSHVSMTVQMKNSQLTTMGELIAELNVFKYYHIIELYSANILRNCDKRQQIVHISDHL